MGRERRWDPCIAHRGDDVNRFVAQYFGQPDRKVLLVAGAGFDPRACDVAARLSAAAMGMRALLVKEDRPNPSQDQSDQADANTKALLAKLAEAQVEPIQIFGSDGAVIGGRSIINILRRQCFEGLTDVVVDISALSVGTSFPIIRYFVERIGQTTETANLHLFVTHNPRLDAEVRSIPGDAPGYVHGFKGGSTLSGAANAALLWLPQLATGQRATLGRLYDFLSPNDTCPVLPFPVSDPRLVDALTEEYLTEIESTWSIDTRNIVYADEGDPLDLYRTILRLDDLRRPVFAETGGSMLVLSPLGSKAMALGALMAALERDLPIAHLEAIGYEFNATPTAQNDGSESIHVWLEGDVYPEPRAGLQTGGSTA